MKIDFMVGNRGKILFENMLADASMIPVFFRYNGVLHNGLSGAKMIADQSREENGRIKVKRVFWLDDALEITAEIAYCPEYDQLEYEILYRNPSDRNSAVLEDMYSAKLKLAGENPQLDGILGDHVHQYLPYRKNLLKESVSFHSTTGRATHIWFPYFNLSHDNGGMFLALGWAGTWKADFVWNGSETEIMLAAVPGTRTILLPGETVSSALVVLLPYARRNEGEDMNLWRRWFIDYNMPKADISGTPIRPFTTAGFMNDTGLPNSDGSISERHDTWQKTVAKIKEENLHMDFHWFDAGWYCDPNGDTVPVDWWGTIGTWELDKEKWPGNSFAEYVAACRKELGMKTLVWFEPERVTNVPALAKNFGYNPEWAFVKEGSGVFTSNIGDPDCLAWTTERILKIMRENDIDLYREDNNSDPESAFAIGDARETTACGAPRTGITENKLIRGHYQLWDNILAYCAENGKCTYLDSCASGGGRNDIASLRRSIPFLRSDSDRTTSSLRLSMTWSFNQWIPFCGASTKETVGQLDTGSDTDAYIYRASFLPIYNLGYAWSLDKSLDYDAIRERIDEWDSIKDYLLGDFYHLTRYHDQNQKDDWTAFCYADRSGDSGIIVAFRMEDCPREFRNFWLPVSRMNDAFRVENVDTGKVQIVRSGDGEEPWVNVQAEQPRTSVLLRFNRIKND